MARRIARRRAQPALLAAAGTFALLACLAGCGDKPAGPKRADHEAAHARRYHPAVERGADGVAREEGWAATQPFAMSAPAELPTTPGPIGTPVLFVNGEPITVQDILEPIIDDLTRRAQNMRAHAYTDFLFRTIGLEMRDQTSLIVVYQQAKRDFPEEAKKLLEEKVDEVIRSIINRRFGGIHARYEQHLKSLDFTLEDIKERARRQILVTQFLHERFAPQLREPPRRDMVNYYEGHRADFTAPPKAELLLIEVPIAAELGKPVAQAAPAELASARQRARRQIERAREELDSGVEFEAVAKTYSKGVRGSTGGSWGEISPGTLTGRWAKAAEVVFTLKEGQVSDVIETEESVFMVKCGRRTAGERLSFEEAQTKIIARIKDEQYNRLTSEYINGLLGRATIERKQQEAFFVAVAAAAPRPVVNELAQEGRTKDAKEP